MIGSSCRPFPRTGGDWYRMKGHGTTDQTLPPEFGGGRRPRGVGINCLVALKREAWRIEWLAYIAWPYSVRWGIESAPLLSLFWGVGDHSTICT